MLLRNLMLLVLATSMAAITALSHAGATQWIPIKVEDGAFLIETRIGGIDGYSLIDTGASINGINQRFVRANKLDLGSRRSIDIIGAYGRERRPLYHRVSANLFGFDTELQDVADLNLGRPDLQLILGAGFLRQFIVQFDYPNQRMRLLTRDMADMKKLSNVKSKPDQETSSVLAKVRLNDEYNTWLMVDTGATGSTLLDRGIATKRGWLNKFPNEVVLGRGVISAGQLERFRLPSLKIGDFEIADTLVSVPAAGQKLELFRKETRTGSNLNRIQSKSKGILGYDVLKHFVVTIDYRIGKVHLEPGAAN